jgi:hypothetical protein
MAVEMTARGFGPLLVGWKIWVDTWLSVRLLLQALLIPSAAQTPVVSSTPFSPIVLVAVMQAP